MAASANKPLVWLYGEVRTPPLSAAARLEAGILLRRLQRGDLFGLPHSRPMPAIGVRCHELRIPDENATWQIIYRIDGDAVVIGEVFSKKTPGDAQVSDRLVQAQVQAVRRHRWREGVSDVDKTKQDRLEAAGWRVGDTTDFLELTSEEAAFVELKLALADYLRDMRVRHGWTQAHVARVLGSSQSRVAKMESADASVTVDLLVKSLLTLGASRKQVGQVIARAA